MRLTRIVHIASAFVATALAVGLLTLGSRPAAAATDLSGSWNASYSLSCAATITQSGSDLSAALDCGKDLQLTLAEKSFGEFEADEFCLVKSELTPEGAKYSVVEKFSLG